MQNYLRVSSYVRELKRRIAAHEGRERFGQQPDKKLTDSKRNRRRPMIDSEHDSATPEADPLASTRSQ